MEASANVANQAVGAIVFVPEALPTLQLTLNRSLRDVVGTNTLEIDFPLAYSKRQISHHVLHPLTSFSKAFEGLFNVPDASSKES